MTDTAIGFIILGVALLVVLGTVFVIASRTGPTGPRPKPPRGVHMPNPSWLPVVMSIAMGLIAAGLAFKPDDQPVNLFLMAPAIVVLLGGIVAWVRAANHEWREVEHGSHDDGAAH